MSVEKQNEQKLVAITANTTVSERVNAPIPFTHCQNIRINKKS